MQDSNPDGPVNYSGSYTCEKKIFKGWRDKQADS